MTLAEPLFAKPLLSAPSPALADLPRAADARLSHALATGAEALALPGEAAVIERLAGRDEIACGVCQQELAAGVAEYLSALDADITAIYSYMYAYHPDDKPPDRAQVALPLYLVICTRRQTAALISLLAALDRALRQSLADRCQTRQVAHVLNVHVVDETEVHNQAGYATLLLAPRREPDRVWKR
ncbi:MAG: hypothetical protein KIS91_06790 [Anaerolineae bacterium]|nr:hypothetical protein [Anaerolineae bacterium]